MIRITTGVLAVAAGLAVLAAPALAAPGTQRVSAPPPTGRGQSPALSADGRLVSFTIGTAAKKRSGIFIRNLGAARTRRVVSRLLVGGADISGDGRVVAYQALNGRGCTRTYVRDRATGRTRAVMTRRPGVERHKLLHGTFALSPDGRYLALLTGRSHNGCSGQPEFAHRRLSVIDLRTHRFRTLRTPDIALDTPLAISSRAGIVAYVASRGYERSGRFDLRVVTIDRHGHRRIRQRLGRGGAYALALSADGKALAFSTTRRLLDTDRRDRDVYVERLASGRLRLASRGTSADTYSSDSPTLSGDGRFVAFDTIVRDPKHPTNLLNGDVYRRDVRRGLTTAISVTPAGRRAGESRDPSISGNGRAIAFTSASPDLVAGDEAADDHDDDVFVRRHLPGP